MPMENDNAIQPNIAHALDAGLRLCFHSRIIAPHQ
jgi:hypothetical protein